MPRRTELRPALDRAARAAIAAGEVPGAVVLVARRGRIVHEAAYGHAQVKPVKAPMRRNTIFDLASLTKPCATALALMQLADLGVLGLRDKVSRWLPRFTGGGKEAVTLLDLATHTGGLDDKGLYDPANPMVTTARVQDLLWGKALLAPPGTSYLYADLNYITLGMAVEAAARLPLDAYVARRIARPLGLRDLGFNPPRSKRSRCASTEAGPAGMLRGAVHDPRARDLGGVAGHAGLFGTARDVWAVAQALVDGGRLGRRRVLSVSAARVMTAPQTPAGLRPRGIGWDTDPGGYGPRGDLFSPAGFGHTGFTGTSVWADPASRTVIVLLTNRVHPAGKGNADPLRRRVANLVASSLPLPPRGGERVWVPRARARSREAAVMSGIDVLEADGFEALKGKRIGLVTNLSVLNRRGETTLDVIRRAPGVTLAAVFTPEHGLEAKLDERVASGGHDALGVPVHSLYGETLRPSPSQLAGLDALVVDLPDIGARFYTYPATLGYCMEACAKAGLEVFVLDRPNPITGLHVEGPRLPRERFGFTGYAALPVRHGMTLGELGRFFNARHRIGAKLTVITMQGWQRWMWFDQTGLPWANPSPNMRSLTQAILYPAVGLLEATNLSVGRGTDAPFERFGAPWLDGPRVAGELNARGLAGVSFYPAAFTPSSGPHRGERCGGVALQLLDRDAFRPVLAGVTMADVVQRVHGAVFKLGGLDAMTGVPSVRESLLRLESPEAIADSWHDDEEAFTRGRTGALLY